MDDISIFNHLTVLESSLSWTDFKESLVALSRFVWLQMQPEESVLGMRGMDTFDPDPEKIDSIVIEGLRVLLKEKWLAGDGLNVILLHLAQATAKLDNLGDDFLRLDLPDLLSDKLPKLDTEEPLSEALGYLLRSRRLNDQDISVLQTSDFELYAQKAVGDNMTAWVCSEVASFQGKWQSANRFRQRLESPGSCIQDYQEAVERCCAELDLNALRACQKTPNDFFCRFGLSGRDMDSCLAQTLAYWAMCEGIRDDSKKDEEGSSPARRKIPSNIIEPVLHQVVAYICKRSTSEDYVPTHVEYCILLNRRPALNLEAVIGRYWASRRGKPVQTWDDGLLARLHAMLQH